MKVVLLNDSFPPVIDGVANTVRNYADLLTAEHGALVEVTTPRYPEVDYSGHPYKVVAYPSFDVSAFTHGYRAGNPMPVRELEAMSEFAPDLIHTHCPFVSSMIARVLREDTGAPLVFTYHTKFDVDIARTVHSERLQAEAARFLVDNISACDEVWVVSHGAGENLKSLGYEGEYRVMDNGVDFPRGRAGEEAVAAATAGFDLPENVPVYLFVGRLMKYKGLPIILDAMRRLSDAGHDFRMVFIGGGADAGEMRDKALADGFAVDIRVCDGAPVPESFAQTEAGGILHLNADSGRSGKVIFVGPVQDREVLRAWNTRGDLFLFPSTYDTNGIVVREAAACGLGSVLIAGSCAAEGVTDGRNGYLVEENADAMAALLLRLGDDLSAMHEVGERAMEEIYISWADSVSAAYDRYQVILEEKRAGKLPAREVRPTDRMVEITAEASQHLGELWLRHQTRRDDMLDNIYGAVGEINSAFDVLEDEARRELTQLTEQRDKMRERLLALRDQMFRK